MRPAAGELSHRSEVGRARRNGSRVRLILDHRRRAFGNRIFMETRGVRKTCGAFQRHGVGRDEDTTPLGDLRGAPLPKDHLPADRNRRVLHRDGYEEAIVNFYHSSPRY